MYTSVIGGIYSYPSHATSTLIVLKLTCHVHIWSNRLLHDMVKKVLVPSIKSSKPTPDTLGTLPDISANARPLRAWLKCRTITTHARESAADLSRNCKGFRARESVHARVTDSRAQGTGVGRDIRQSPSRVRSVFLLIYGSK